MAVFTKQYFGTVGNSFIQDPALSYVQILQVDRNDKLHSEAEATPGTLQFLYTAGTGRIDFDPTNPFIGPVGDRPNRDLLEKIKVTYKI